MLKLFSVQEKCVCAREKWVCEKCVILATVSVQTTFPSHLFQQPAHPYLLLHQHFLRHQPLRRPLQVQLILKKQRGCCPRRGALPVSSGNERSKRGGREKSLKGDPRPLQWRRNVFSCFIAAVCVYFVVVLWYTKHSTEPQETQVPPPKKLFSVGFLHRSNIHLSRSVRLKAIPNRYVLHWQFKIEHCWMQEQGKVS